MTNRKRESLSYSVTYEGKASFAYFAARYLEVLYGKQADSANNVRLKIAKLDDIISLEHVTIEELHAQ